MINFRKIKVSEKTPKGTDIKIQARQLRAENLRKSKDDKMSSSNLAARKLRAENLRKGAEMEMSMSKLK